jgi:hypothetical protein
MAALAWLRRLVVSIGIGPKVVAAQMNSRPNELQVAAPTAIHFDFVVSERDGKQALIIHDAWVR